MQQQAGAGQQHQRKRDFRGDQKIARPKPTADAVIVLWMAGGMAAPETFDPKKYVPFEVGLPVDKVMSTFPAIDTAVDNIKISAGLPTIGTRSGIIPELLGDGTGLPFGR